PLPKCEEPHDEREPNAVAKLLDITTSRVTLYRTNDQRAVAKDGNDIYYVKSREFRLFLRRLCRENRLILNRETINIGLEELESMALDGEIIDLKVRVAKHKGKHYLDLCNDAREVVEIDKSG